MTSLLDVNVLVSLLDANHGYHAVAKRWFDQNNGPWASCPITQNGYLRIVTRDSYPNTISIEKAITTLKRAVSMPSHAFLSDDISLLDPNFVTHKHIQGHNQLTDIYLLALSVHHGARFVTFDQGVSRIAVPQATEDSLHIISP